MNLHLGVLRAVLGLALLTSAPDPCVADDQPSFPGPTGFIESSALVPGLKDQALIGQPPTTHLIGFYLLPDELAKRMRGAQVPLTIACRAYVIAERSSEDASRAAFKQLVASVKRDAKNFDLSDPDNQRIIQHFEDATKERYGASPTLNGMTALGIILESEDVFAISAIVAFTLQNAEGQVAVPIATAAAWLRRGTRIVKWSVVGFEKIVVFGVKRVARKMLCDGLSKGVLDESASCDRGISVFGCVLLPRIIH